MTSLALSDGSLPSYLAEVGLVPPDLELNVESGGDGNINWVRRVSAADGRSWIVKQARPALDAFPEYSAPTERIAFERRWLEIASAFDGGGLLPRVDHFDPHRFVLVLEDLSRSERMDAALARGAGVTAAFEAIGGLLGRVHAATRNPRFANEFANDGMRRLHGDHIFHIPYRDNDFPLSRAVAERAAKLRGDAALVARIDAAYARYLEPHGALLHADVQPTNILIAASGAASGAKLLDAEIAHVGDPAFDVGVPIGHLLLAGLARGDAAAERAAIEALWSAYASAHGEGAPQLREAALYAGIEMLRRTIGAARVPGVDRDDVALAALDHGSRLVAAPAQNIAELVTA